MRGYPLDTQCIVPALADGEREMFYKVCLSYGDYLAAQ